jgi:hypothetical protein
MTENKIKNGITDTRRKVKYIIWADSKLDRREMLDIIRKFNYNTLNIRQKAGNIIEIDASDYKD